MRHFICTSILFFLSGATPFIFAQEASELTPPQGWECIEDPEQLPQKVQVIYVGTGKTQFTPSINIACESTNLEIDEYVKQAKTYHEEQGNTMCTRIGQLKTRSGEVSLLQIDRPSQWGDVRFIQAMMIHESNAYVITATCLKQEFGALSAQIFKSIQSLHISADGLK